jgi:hypothetical protein
MASKGFRSRPQIYKRLKKHAPAYGGEGRRMGRMVDSEGGVHFERQGLLPPSSLIRVKAAALLSID